MSARSAFERRLRRELRSAAPPRAADAERRAWHVVRAAHAGHAPIRRPRRGARLAVALAAGVAAAALALSPAGAKVGDWIGDVVDSAPNATHTSLASLPAPGRLLVVADGGAWVVRDDGHRRQLGPFSDATWSPGGLHVAAARGRELVALEPDGLEHWTLTAPGPVSVPRWSPDGFRIAYRSGRALWVVTGDDAARWVLARDTLPVAPAWKPLAAPAEQVVAFAAADGRVRIVEVDSRRLRGRTPAGPAPRELWWGDHRLVLVMAHAVRVHGPRGRLLRTVELPRGATIAGSAMSPDGRRLALLTRRGATSSLLVLEAGREPRTLFSARGELAGLSWSIDGSRVVLGLPAADEWLFVGVRGGFEVVRDIRRVFRGGHEPRRGTFPRPAGWCYAEQVNRAASGQPPCVSGSRP